MKETRADLAKILSRVRKLRSKTNSTSGQSDFHRDSKSKLSEEAHNSDPYLARADPPSKQLLTD